VLSPRLNDTDDCVDIGVALAFAVGVVLVLVLGVAPAVDFP